LARAGVASRRGAEALIAAGRVTIGGRRAVLGDRIAPDDELRVDGRIVESAAEHRTFALHKPRGVVTSAADERGRRTVLDLLPAVAGLHPVGRLDLDSEGLLLLTTDGELTLRLTHPRYGHAKTYRVWCLGGSPDAEALSRLRDGVLLDDGWARADDVRPAAGGAVLVLREGRKRQVRRMLAAVAHRSSGCAHARRRARARRPAGRGPGASSAPRRSSGSGILGATPIVTGHGRGSDTARRRHP
jgi:23S rRNA pseudouridine2605 synthase